MLLTRQEVERCAEIKAQIKVLQDEFDGYKEQMMVSLKELDSKSINTGFGTFYITSRRKWTYSPAVGKVEEKLDALKTKEEKEGIATAETSESIAFRDSKYKENN